MCVYIELQGTTGVCLHRVAGNHRCVFTSSCKGPQVCVYIELQAITGVCELWIRILFTAKQQNGSSVSSQILA